MLLNAVLSPLLCCWYCLLTLAVTVVITTTVNYCPTSASWLSRTVWKTRAPLMSHGLLLCPRPYSPSLSGYLSNRLLQNVPFPRPCFEPQSMISCCLLGYYAYFYVM